MGKDDNTKLSGTVQQRNCRAGKRSGSKEKSISIG